ncbi:MAG TPA: glycosyltransferase family 4 protein [Longimicrobiaceae bacterium]|nr:glycosyltransferase family 4 protein [Longimicrobiaceae bacterium]
MKILLLNWQDIRNPQSGGAEIHLDEIFSRLVARGHQVTLLCSSWTGAAHRQTINGIDVHRVGSRHTYGIRAPFYYRTRLAGTPFDMVVEALNKVPVFSPLWARARGMLLVHHLFGATAFREASAPVASITWLLERPLATVYRGMPVEAISESTASDLVERGLAPGDIRVIHPGVDLEYFTPEVRDRADVPTFLYLGRLRRYKRIDLILRAAAVLRDEGVDVELVIGGRGEWEQPLRSLAERLRIADRTTFAGFVSESEKRDLYRRAWANVFPSPKEGWGITNIEAAACATPSIASDAPGLRESVVNGRTGVLFEPLDEMALAAAMRELAHDPIRVASLGAAAAEFAQGFSWDRAADETESHLQGLHEMVGSTSHAGA